MQSPGSMYDATKQSWFWKFEADVLWLSANDQVRFKVREVIFKDSTTKGAAHFAVVLH